MKNFLNLFAIIFLIALSSCSASKEMSAELSSTRASLDDCQSELDRTKAALADAKNMSGSNSELVNQLRAEKNALENQLANSQSQLASAQQNLKEVTKQMQATSDNYGVWFRVQIGAYQDRRIDNSLETTDQLSLEERNELQKIALGRFRNYDDAKRLQTQLQEMGLKDAWVVSYKDGERVPIEQVRN